MNVSKIYAIGSIVKIIANRIKSIILLRRITIKGNRMTNNKKDLSERDLKGEKVDILAFSSLTALMLVLALSFYNDIKTDSSPRVMKALTGWCALGTCISSASLGKSIKDYRQIKREIANKVNEKQK